MGMGRHSDRVLRTGLHDDHDDNGNDMNRQELIRDIKKDIGSFPNISQIAGYMGISRDKVREMVAGLDCFTAGKQKQYFVNDVADSILRMRTI